MGSEGLEQHPYPIQMLFQRLVMLLDHLKRPRDLQASATYPNPRTS